MKRTGLIVLAILIFCFPLLSCVKDEEDPAVTAMKGQIVDLKNAVATLTENLKTTTKTATDANANATAALQKANQVTTPDLSAYSTKATVPENFLNNLTEAQLTTLKTKLGINSSSGSGSAGGSTTITGQVTSSFDRTASVWGNNTNFAWVYKITNGTNQWQYVKPAIVITSPSPYGAISTAPLISMQQGNYQWVTADFGYLPALSGTNRASFDVVPSTGGENGQGERYLAPGTTIDININIAITSNPTTTLWTITPNVRSRQ